MTDRNPALVNATGRESAELAAFASGLRFEDLPEETKAFLVALRPDEVKTLDDGIRLVRSISTVSAFVKWIIVGILGIAVGIAMFGESIAKIVKWFQSSG